MGFLAKRYFVFPAGIIIGIAILSSVSFAKVKYELSAHVNSYSKLVKTEYGLVKGFVDEYNTCCWKGIPFAKPPVGNLRWKAPQDPESWNGVLKTTEFSDVCPQYSENSTKVIGSEDCLYLNVWRPRDNFDGPLPIYFWVHGGGHSVGSACEARYVGAKLANKGNMIVVTTNYRLGPFGWFTHPELRTGNEFDDSGNYGTLDLVKALEWVQNNITEFGGDPNRVTIAGVSAGAINVMSLVVSPLAEGLFHKAISESGPIGSASVEDGVISSNKALSRILEEDELSQSEVSDIAQYLRSKTPTEILLAYNTRFYSMLTNDTFTKIFRDGEVIPDNGFAALGDSSSCNQVPMIIGRTQEEHKFFMFMGENFDEYTPAEYQNFAEDFTSDFWHNQCVSNPVNYLLSNSGQPNIYVYIFRYGAYRYNDNYNPDEEKYNAWPTDPDNYALKIGATHAIEIPFYWGNFIFFYGYEDFLFREDNRVGREALSDACIEYISNFVHTGVPSAKSFPVWENWSTYQNPKWINFDANDTEAIIYEEEVNF